jgi:Protein of unknown function (DUF616)
LASRLIYTAITAGHAELHDHPDIPDTDFVCYSDDPIVHQDLSDRWELRPVEAATDLSPRRRAKFHKIFPPSPYEWTVWVDGSHRLRLDSTDMVDAMIAASPHGFGLHKHPRLDCIYPEGDAALTLWKCRDQPIMEQLQHYRREGHPPNWGLWACGSICRRQSPLLDGLMQQWWSQILTWSERDQISLAYVLRSADLRPDEWPWQLYANPYFAEISHNWEEGNPLMP